MGKNNVFFRCSTPSTLLLNGICNLFMDVSPPQGMTTPQKRIIFKPHVYLFALAPNIAPLLMWLASFKNIVGASTALACILE